MPKIRQTPPGMNAFGGGEVRAEKTDFKGEREKILGGLKFWEKGESRGRKKAESRKEYAPRLLPR